MRGRLHGRTSVVASTAFTIGAATFPGILFGRRASSAGSATTGTFSAHRDSNDTTCHSIRSEGGMVVV